MHRMIQQVTIEADYTDGMCRAERFCKRLFDVVGAIIGLILLSPLFLVIMIVLRIQGDSVFFKQERVGYQGRLFNIFKFRTMDRDAEKDGIPRLVNMDDEHLTKIGTILRAHHLDELPQLLNVLKGEMSFVGPRPERKYFVDQILKENNDYVYIYRMIPGTTSLATLFNGYTDTMEKMLIRLQMDLDYYQKRSLWMDLKIMLLTFKYLLFGKKF